MSLLNLARCVHEAFFNKQFLPGTKERQSYYQQLHHDEKRQLYATMRYALAFWLSLQQELPKLSRKKHLELAHCCSFIALERLLSGTAPIYHISAQLKSDLQKLRVGWSLSLYLPWIKKFESFEDLFNSVREHNPIGILTQQHPNISVKDIFGHPPLGVRLHDISAGQELDPLSIQCQLSDETLILKKNTAEAQTLFAAGKLSYQNPSAQLLAALMTQVLSTTPERPQHFLDACAAPGAKTQILLEVLGSDQTLLCCDLPNRIEALEDNLERRESSLTDKVSVIGHDWLEGPLSEDAQQEFDVIVLDGPCSGSGVTRKHPDALWRLNSEQISAHQERLKAIGDAVLGHLKSGGVMIYATCSLLNEENDAVIEQLLQSHGAQLEVLPLDLGCGYATKNGWQVLPDHAHDGLFYAALRRGNH